MSHDLEMEEQANEAALDANLIYHYLILLRHQHMHVDDKELIFKATAVLKLFFPDVYRMYVEDTLPSIKRFEWFWWEPAYEAAVRRADEILTFVNSLRNECSEI